MRVLLAPRWLVAHFVVLLVCVGCIVAGFWQLDRLQERRTANAIQQARYQQAPRPVGDLVELSGGDVDSLEYRRATATGSFLPEEEVLVRSQVFSGQSGYDVVTPLRLQGGGMVMVNRGWVPSEYDTAPVAAAPPPSGRTTVQAVVRLSQERAALGREDILTDEVDAVSRIDLAFLDGATSSDLLPVYLEVVGDQDPTSLPIPARPPDFGDEGPHLSYAIQWFSFAAVGVFGYGFLIRRAVRRPSGGEAGDDFDTGQPGEVGPA